MPSSGLREHTLHALDALTDRQMDRQTDGQTDRQRQRVNMFVCVSAVPQEPEESRNRRELD